MKALVVICCISLLLGNENKPGFSEDEMEKLRDSFIEEGDPAEIKSILNGTYKSKGPSILDMWDAREAQAETRKLKKKKIEVAEDADPPHLYCPVCGRDMTMDGSGPEEYL